MKVLLTVICFLGVLLPAVAQSFPEREPIWGYGFTNAFPTLAFDQPVAVVAPPGSTNRLFIVERTGNIRVIPETGSPRLMTFLSLPETWYQGDEAGLLGLAFHPDYERNGRFFVYRTIKRNGLRCELAEFRVSTSNRDKADPASERLIISQVDGIDTHNAGDLKFGPDGYLYLSLGDEAPTILDAHSQPQAIDRGFFAGIIRIDVDNKEGNLLPNPHHASVGGYRVPVDNPFVGATEFNGFGIVPSQVRTEFYAVGLRNPWRFTFDPSTGEMICADVGEAYYEEINIVQKGRNYGWPYVEGPFNWETDRPADLKEPLYHYLHGVGNFEGRVVIGGLVVGAEQLGEIYGRYIFSDFESGNVWALNTRARETNAMWVTARRGIVSYAVDPRDGGVLAANLLSGRIEKLVYRSPDDLEIPAQIRDLRAFDDLSTLKPASGLLPYEIINPLWSDGAAKQRWVSRKDARGKIEFAATEPWKFPAGMFWVKHFELELTNGVPESRRRLETRFLVKTEEGVYGLSYRWGDSMTNAILLPPYPTNETFVVHDGGTTRTQVWNYPGWEQCRTCHTPKSGGALSFNTYQLNREVTWDGATTNQLAALVALDFFANPTDVNPEKLPRLVSMNDPIAPAQHKARSYLFSNCSHCHQPGVVLGPTWDGRISTPLSKANLVNGASYFYPPPMKMLAPESETNSFVLVRSSSRASNLQMPPLATSVVDHQFLESLTNWIANMPDATWKYADVGACLAEGVAEQVGDGLRLSGAGKGVTNESFFYGYREIAGSTEFVTRISNLRVPTVESEAGIMLRDGLGAESCYAAVVVKNESVSLLARTAEGGTDRIIGSMPIFTEAWLKILRSEEQVSGWLSSDGVEWTLLGTTEVNLPDEAKAGFFVASAMPSVHFAGAGFESTSIICVKVPEPATSPIELPQPISVRPEVATFPRRNVSLSLFADGELIGTAIEAPYAVEWNWDKAGEVALRGVASGEHGSITSAPVRMEFTAPASAIWTGTIDSETGGDWRRGYGSEGYLIPGLGTNESAQVKIEIRQSQGTLRLNAEDRFALEAEGQQMLTLLPGSPTLEIALKGDELLPHRIGIYFYDWLGLGATQTIYFYREGEEVVEPVMIPCEEGTYMTFVLRGEVTLKIENPRGSAHISGIFIDPVEQVSVEFLKPAEDLEVVQPSVVPLEVRAFAPGREIRRVEIRNGDTQLARLETAPYATTLSNLFTGEHKLTAVAYGTFG